MCEHWISTGLPAVLIDTVDTPIDDFRCVTENTCTNGIGRFDGPFPRPMRISMMWSVKTWTAIALSPSFAFVRNNGSTMSGQSLRISRAPPRPLSIGRQDERSLKRGNP